ncbi:outer membrane protein transport protein [Desulfuromonas sp. KJ2020]|uniref:OmpP1/FadL family transporter n=1 Tax=Desulfuromonas sp. KJ2020 TaxID=2919173 RepID=UPI0020A82CAB|nr:outer membrane protein transport protein [Desulfuromonas sp. KJ2020]MCP3177326.1 outer membrane protein transport protein [Desulfuromonas sp. KJ2020]
MKRFLPTMQREINMLSARDVRSFFLAILTGALLFPQSILASGFGIFTQGASALGQANATVAHADGPSALYFNPALLTELPGTGMELGTTLIYPRRDFTSDTTGREDFTDSTLYTPSTFYLTHALNDRFSAGIGLLNPFGLGTEWNTDWEGRYLATRSEIVTYMFNPAVGYRPNSWLSIGAGLNLLYLDATLEKQVKLAFVGLSDGQQKFTGDGTGVGFNLGILLKLNPKIQFGAGYRSSIKVDIDGRVNFTLPDPSLAAILPDTTAQTDINLPQQLVAGLAFFPTDNITLETGIRWEDWSSYDELHISFAQPVNGSDFSIYPKNWQATWAWNLGGKYRLNERVFLLAGYLYGEDAIGNATFEPSVPDSDSQLFCLGATLNFDRLTISLSYGYQLLEDRSKNNSYLPDVNPAVADSADYARGRYESQLHLLGVSAGYRF